VKNKNKPFCREASSNITLNYKPVFVFCLLLILLLPSFLLVGLSLASMSVGIVSAIVFIFLLIMLSWESIKFRVNTIRLAFIPISIVTIVSLFFLLHDNIAKPVLSILPILLMFFIASEVSKKIYQQNIDLVRIVGPTMIILSALGLAGVLGYQPTCCNFETLGKPIFPFSEPSHYALSFGPLAVGFAFYSNITKVFVVALLFAALGLAISNLTLIVFSTIIFLSSTLRLKRIYFILLIPILILLTLGVILILIELSPHFAERLDVGADYNKTTLFYLRGFELAYLNFIDTYGLGLGFQMLGSEFTSTGEYHDLIILLDSRSVETDSGFLAAKIIAEFGFLGVISVMAYIYVILWAILRANTIHRVLINVKDIGKHRSATKKLFFMGVIVGLSVEMFLRSYGYFSPGVFLLLVAILYLKRCRYDPI
jgi:hypothetical protein